MGVRHSFFLNATSKIFINGAFNFYIPFNSEIVPESMAGIKTAPGNNFTFGLGYKHLKYSLEAQYGTPRNILANYLYLSSGYKVFSIIAGLSLFKNSK